MKNHFYKVITIICLTIVCACANDKKEDKPQKSDKKTITKETPVNKRNTYKFPALGIDISKYQGDEIDVLSMKKDKLQFVICKATEGITYTDPKFSENWNAIKEKGFIRGAYHFYISADSPKDQAEHFLNTLKGLEPTDIPPIIDIEESGIDKSYAVEDVQESVLSLLQEIDKAINATPIIYSNTSFANKYLNNEAFANYPLWVADYDAKANPDIPSAWKTKGFTFWQKTDNYDLDGFTDDADVFNGDMEQLKAFIKKSYR
jgi:lysozyme